MPSGLGHAARLAEISGSEFFAAYSDGRNKSVTYAFVGRRGQSGGLQEKVQHNRRHAIRIRQCARRSEVS
jgi:hypothetical protein